MMMMMRAQPLGELQDPRVMEIQKRLLDEAHCEVFRTHEVDELTLNSLNQAKRERDQRPDKAGLIEATR